MRLDPRSMAIKVDLKSYIGKKFGMLEIVDFPPLVTGKQRKASCRCECGKTKEVRWASVRDGSIKSCGCLISKMRIGVKKPKTASDLADKKFGCLTAIKQEYMERGAWHWSFICDCGNTIIRRGALVKAGGISSCGCAKKNCGNYTHRMSKSHEYNSWCAMKDRCFNSNNKRYADYGGRGIAVCDKWVNSFENFFADMGERPEPKENYSLDRIDNSLGYSPENCKWSTREEQMMNRRNTVYLTLFYESTLQTKTIKEWSEVTGISASVIIARKRRGWLDHKILQK